LPARSKNAGSHSGGQESTRALLEIPKKSDRAKLEQVKNQEVEKTLSYLSDSSLTDFSDTNLSDFDVDASIRSGLKPETEVKAPEDRVKSPETTTSTRRSTHVDKPEVEPGVVAKNTAADGHEIKVLKDGRVVRCSNCGEIRQQYKDVLDQYPNLKQRLDDIENIKNLDEKAKEATKLEKELSQKKKIKQLSNKWSNKWNKLQNKIRQKLNRVFRGANNRDAAANGVKNTFDGSQMPSGTRPEENTPSGSQPAMDMPGVKQPEIEETDPKTNTPTGGSTHVDEPEVKESADILEQNPEIKQHLDEIENKKIADEKGKASEQELKAPETNTPTGRSTHVDEPNVKQVLNAVKSRIANQSDKFELTYTKDQLDSIIKKGKELGLSDKVIEDLIYTGSRKAKAIDADKLIGQMEHWVNVISKRGFPEKFTDLNDFQQFSKDLFEGVKGADIPADDIRIQGSSLRTTKANDVDIAVFVDQPTFNRLLIQRYHERITKKETKTKVSLNDKSHDELVQLAKDIAANPGNYNNQGGTFQNALLNGIISSKSDIIKPLKNVSKEINAKYPHLNVESISVLIRDGRFDVKPDLPITKNQDNE
jgi:hypothetical protein